MKYKKVRGINRRLRHIQHWIDQNTVLDLQFLLDNQCDYVKFQVDPWNRLTITNSKYPQLQGLLKQLFVQGLVTIYQAWKIQLQHIDQPYYLKIWLFEQEINRSQVVCAIGDKINDYQNVFQHVAQQVEITDSAHYVELAPILVGFSWQNKVELQLYAQDDVGLPQDYPSLKAYYAYRRWFDEHVIQGHQSVIQLEQNNYYVVEHDRVWLGDID